MAPRMYYECALNILKICSESVKLYEKCVEKIVKRLF